jgi:signal peptidase
VRNNILQDKVNKGILSLTLYIIVVVCIGAFLLHFINGKSDGIFGYTARIVVSGSMEPEIKVNSLTIIKKCEIEDIQEGDIICFNYSQDIIHRVIEITTSDSGATVLHTKGDANESADDIEIYDQMVIGKVVHTFNGITSIVEKYSVSPGKVDGVSLSRDIIIRLIFIGLVLFVVAWIVSIVKIILHTFSKKDCLEDTIDKYLKDIDELILYREVLKQLKDNNIKNTNETRFRFIMNRVSKAKAEIEIKNLHYDIKDFKRAVKHCIYINKLGEKMDLGDDVDSSNESKQNIKKKIHRSN